MKIWNWIDGAGRWGKVRAETEAEARGRAQRASLRQHRQYSPGLLSSQAPAVRVRPQN